ncbi:MAG: T9SS type A sorting domain-containing protein [Chitinophagales bacterium]
MKNPSKNSNIKYSQFAGVYLLLHTNSNAQVIYTDVDPDLILSESPQGIWLDIDENGISDIGLQNDSFTTYSFSLQETHTFQFLIAFLYTTENAIAGISDADGTCFPYALSAGELVGGDSIWQTCFSQFLAFKRLHSAGLTHVGTYENWYNELISETLDHYLGVRFIDEFGNNHNGWIRCDIIDEGRTLIIKDYAYETQDDFPIIAGDTSGFVGLENLQSTINATVYSFNNTIYINFNDFLKGVEIRIYDLNGKIVYADKIKDQFEKIELNEAKGVYLVELVAGENKFTRKIFIN